MPPRIFISYRRADSKHITSRIRERLTAAFGDDAVFHDVEKIPPGSDFRSVLREATSTCRIMLVVIGKGWVNATDASGNRRLDNPADFVRIEVETGLQRDGVTVIPLLVDGAEMPAESQLPDSLKLLAYKHAFTLHDDPIFTHDVDTLTRYLRTLFGGSNGRLMRYVAAALALLILVGALALIMPPLLAPSNQTPTPTFTDVVIAPSFTFTDAPPTNALSNTPTFTISNEFTPTRGSPTATSDQSGDSGLGDVIADIVENNATISGSLACLNPFVDCEAGSAPAITATSEPYAAALDRATNFTSTQNTDWLPFVYTIPDDPAAAPMVLVPVGSFQMGSPDGVGSEDEHPMHTQTFTEPFWIDQTEVTRAQYILCVDAGACPIRPISQQSTSNMQPINHVTWFQGRDYCAWRAVATGDAYRLPQEREWEYAARGVESWIYPWGNNDPTTDLAAYGGLDATADVASKPRGASWVGALDLSGNVYEWVNSLYMDYEAVYNPADGREVDTGERTDVRRVLRGGSFNDGTYGVRGALRGWNDPNNWFNDVGFRCARDA